MTNLFRALMRSRALKMQTWGMHVIPCPHDRPQPGPSSMSQKVQCRAPLPTYVTVCVSRILWPILLLCFPYRVHSSGTSIAWCPVSIGRRLHFKHRRPPQLKEHFHVKARIACRAHRGPLNWESAPRKSLWSGEQY